MSLRIYLAGKIATNDWRHTLIERAGCHYRLLRDSNGPFAFTLGRHELVYQGPFFTSCDHGCYHGDRNHGRGLVAEYGCPEGNGLIIDGYDDRNDPDREDARRCVYGECLDAISASDVVFAFIADPTCFGTLFEVGYAKALAKPAFLCFSDAALRDAMWFPAQGSNRKATVGTDPYAELLLALDQHFPPSYADLLASPQWQKRRLQIMERDGWACTKCRNTITELQVHPTSSIAGKAPWEYPDELLTTRCKTCRDGTHGK